MSRRVLKEVVKRRAAFDIGSGSTKFQCSDYSCDKQLILRTIFQEERPVLYGADFLKSHNGTISESIQEIGLQTLHDLKVKGEELGVEEYSAIATEVFRKASNGMEYLQRIRSEIGIPVQLLTQEMEAVLGYKSVTSFDKSIPIVWDSGASSFQISMNSSLITSNNDEYEYDIIQKKKDSVELSTYMDSIGASVANRLFVESIRNENVRHYRSDINPVTEAESMQLIHLLQQRLPPPPSWLTQANVTVGAAGVNNSIFKLCCDVLSDEIANSTATMNTDRSETVTSFTRDQATQALYACLNQTNDELQKYVNFAYADSTNPIVIKLSLLVAVMQHTGIQHVRTFPSVGSCPGVICEKKYWQTT